MSAATEFSGEATIHNELGTAVIASKHVRQDTGGDIRTSKQVQLQTMLCKTGAIAKTISQCVVLQDFGNLC